MHFVTGVEYEAEFRLRLRFEDGGWRVVDLSGHLDGEIFEPLRDLALFRTARLNEDIDTVVWDNGADMSPDFLYDASVPVEIERLGRVAETHGSYGCCHGKTGTRHGS